MITREKKINLGLSPREAEALQLLSEGLSNIQICSKMWISRSTLLNHFQSIYTKLGRFQEKDITTRLEAVVFYYKNRELFYF